MRNPPGQVVGEPGIGARVVLGAADRGRVGAGVLELGLLGGEEQHRPRPELERDGPAGLELGVDRRRLGQELVDPRGGLPEEEAAVSPARPRADRAALDTDDRFAALSEVTRDGAPGQAAARDDRIGAPRGQLSGGSPPPFALRAGSGLRLSSSPFASARASLSGPAPFEERRQKTTAPAAAPAAARSPAVFATVLPVEPPLVVLRRGSPRPSLDRADDNRLPDRVREPADRRLPPVQHCASFRRRVYPGDSARVPGLPDFTLLVQFRHRHVRFSAIA